MSAADALPKPIAGEDRSLAAYLKAAFEHRRMIWLMATKIVRDMHSGTVLGIWWVIVRAIMPTIAIIFILQQIAVFQQPGFPYALYVASGMLLWTPFHIGMRKGMRALSQTARLRHSFSFPTINVSLAANALSSVYLSIFVVFLFLVIAWFAIFENSLYLVFGWQLLLAPAIIALMFVFMSGVLSFLSVIFLVARDIRFMMQILLQFWFVATPIVYHLTLLPEQWRGVLLVANPMANLVESFRWSLFNTGEWSVIYFAVTVSEVLLTFLAGAWFMMRSEKALKIVL